MSYRVLNVATGGQLALRSAVLRAAGLVVVEATAAVDALAALTSHEPDLVLADVSLPDFNGFELCRLIRDDPATAIVPVVLIGAPGLVQSHRRRGQQSGADAVVTDRTDPDELRALVRALLRARQAVGSLRKRASWYGMLFDSSNDAAFVYEAGGGPGQLIEVNEAACQRLGYGRAELLKMSMQDIDAPDTVATLPTVLQRLRTESHAVWEGAHLTRDGRRYPVEISAHLFDLDGKPTILSTARDITERKRIEDALRASEAHLCLCQKAEAVGQLAVGIAHDFNNLLTAVLGYSDLVLAQLPVDDPLRSEVEEIRRAGESATSLTRQLLAFSRRQILQPARIDLNVVVGNAEKMLRRLLGEQIDLQVAPGSDLEFINADPGQIEQVVVNLALNARDAMPQGGKLTVETDSVELDASCAQHHVTVVPGRYVMLAVSDTGAGMTPEVQARIFEPFFTTKELGHGTGMGLSTVYGIVKQSGGYIWVYSQLGKGTTFRVYLPRAEREIDAPIAPHADVSVVPTGTETVLLVEDDAGVRELARLVLHRYGYLVLPARHAEEALALCELHDGPIHLMMTDIVLPGLGGLDLAKRATALRSSMKVLYSSGYGGNAVVHRGELDVGTAFLPKPYTPAVLARKVREVIDKEP
jgi:two-component system cell cycle sensor histidine kinase/response regulator CckA